jgi:hypothetical protein
MAARLVQCDAVMNHIHIIRMVCGASLVSTGLLVACGGSDANTQPEYPGTGVTNAQRVDSSVANRLAEARCDREQTCNNVGAGQKYTSRAVCIDQMRGSLANDLNAYECPRGIDDAQLHECMTAIRTEECGHPFDTLSRMEKCRTGALCMK